MFARWSSGTITFPLCLPSMASHPPWSLLAQAMATAGLLLPVLALTSPGAVAAELNLDGVGHYAGRQDQVTNVGQFSDVRPGDWAYQALSNLVERYGCVAGYPNGTFRGGQAMTRYEAAALLNACMDRVSELTDELKRLTTEFAKELAVLRGKVDGLEARVGELEATQFSTTTKLNGMAVFVVGANAFRGSAHKRVNEARAVEGGTTFNYNLELNFDTSFTGKDLLHTVLRAGNFADSAFGNGQGLNELEVAFQEVCNDPINCRDVLGIDKLFYQFPIGKQWTATLGPVVGQEDMLAVWPNVYPDDTILNLFTFNGASAAYNQNRGAGAGLWWKNEAWSVSANYVAAAGDTASTDQGGLGNLNSQGSGSIQLAYAKDNWALAGIYSYVQQNTEVPNTTPLAAVDWAVSGPGHINTFGLSGFWQPLHAGWFPSISAGWGLNSYSYDQGVSAGSLSQSQSWAVGLQWDQAFAEANVLGFAFGQPVFATSLTGSQTPKDGNYAFELWYKFQVTDQISVTPAMFYLSRPEGEFTPSGKTFNNFGGLVKTTFKF